MLIRFLPHKVAEFWDEILPLVQRGVPLAKGESPEKFNNILEALLTERMVCWVSVDSQQKRADGIMLTMITRDAISETYSLLVYCIASIKRFGEQSWIEGVEALIKYATASGCVEVVSFASNPVSNKWTEKLGFDSETRYVVYKLV